MGGRFKQITGIDPYTVNLSMTVEKGSPDLEASAYRYAADHDLIHDETVFVKDGQPLSLVPGSNDCSVFLPRTKLEMGRPDWLHRELHRYPFPLPESLLVGEGRHLAQAFYGDEPDTAIPVDQILVEAGERTATLMVPPTALWVRVLDEKGVPSKTIRFKMSALDRESDEEESVADRELAKELARRVEVDQKARTRLIEEGRRSGESAEFKAAQTATGQIDEENTRWLKDLVAKRGWPSRSMFGASGSHDAWLLVQHADRDQKFQRQCLDLMKPLVAKNEVSKLDYAYLTDRVLLAEGKKQLYGTQASIDSKGHAQLRPTEDRKNLDKRRAEVGLGPIGEYLKMIEQMYGPKPKGG
jgi:hypothetical protein